MKDRGERVRESVWSKGLQEQWDFQHQTIIVYALNQHTNHYRDVVLQPRKAKAATLSRPFQNTVQLDGAHLKFPGPHNQFFLFYAIFISKCDGSPLPCSRVHVLSQNLSFSLHVFLALVQLTTHIRKRR